MRRVEAGGEVAVEDVGQGSTKDSDAGLELVVAAAAHESQRNEVVFVVVSCVVMMMVVVVMVWPLVGARAPVLSAGALLLVLVHRQVDVAGLAADEGAVAPGELRRRDAL